MSDEEKIDAVKLTRETICTSQYMLDDLISWRESNLKQIAVFSDINHPCVKEYVDFLKNENILYEINGKLILYYLDIMVAYKNMITIYDDWEVRVHIRRICTLLYECIMFCKALGRPIKCLKGPEDNEAVNNYDSSLKSLRFYLEKYESRLEEIRHKTEAHKDPDLILQINLIENISIKEFFKIIDTSIKKLNALIQSMVPLFRQFNTKLEELKSQIPVSSN